MTEARDVVVETSVHVSAMVFSKSNDSAACEVVHRGVSGHYRFVLSPALEGEIARKLIRSFRLPARIVSEYLAQLRGSGVVIEDPPLDESVWCRDAADVFILMLARAARAWGVVTYDNDFDAEASTRSAVTCWKPGPFLALLREARGEPPGHRHTTGAVFSKEPR